MKKKITFTEEHIALIRALNFTNIDFDEVLKSYEQYNVKTAMVADGCQTITQDSDVYTENGQIVECTVGDILNRYNISIDSIYGLDNYNLWGGTYLWEQIAWIIGIHDHAYPETLEDPTGVKFPPEDIEHMKELDSFIVSHLKDIIDILLQFCTEGIQPGVTYWCYDYQGIWHKEDA